MRVLPFAFCAFVAGCASSGAGTPVDQTRPQMETIQVMTANGVAMPMAMVHDESSYGAAVPLPLNQAFLALRVVYDSLGIPVTTLDPTRHSIGNNSFRIRHLLAKVPLSRYINCGTTQGGPSADSYEIILSVTTTVTQKGDSALVMSRVDGQGRPQSVAGDYVHCATTAQLETKIASMVRAVAGK